MTLNRRDFLAMGAALAARSAGGLAAWQAPGAPPVGRLVQTMALGRFDGRPKPPLGTLLDTGLDARQFTDLAALSVESLVTPTDKFFVRTAASQTHRRPGTWSVDLADGRGRTSRLTIDDLARRARPMGTHVMECSGNFDPANFGLLSAAEWSGVPIGALLDRLGPMTADSMIRISGLDEPRDSRSSVAGAAWVFNRNDLERTAAFLALEMNGVALTPDHGWPVRLVVPNWYGCACIKWVTQAEPVPVDEPATTQMREFAARTHQNGVPARAREYQPATIELAATPIRVEKRTVDGGIFYRVVGIRWGGSTTNRLTIRFRHTEPFVPVEDSPRPASMTTWNLWSHTWRPSTPGRYQIALGVADKSIPARRLDLYYYTREVEIDET